MQQRSISRAVLITGCSSGIGRATALRLVRDGWPVWATARRLQDIADLAPAGCRTLALDVTREDSMQAAVQAVEREHQAVGVLVNNAGYSQSGALESVSLDLAREQFETNVFGLLRITQLVLPGMRRQGWGKIVNLGSMAGKVTFPGGGLYHASKHALEAISDALRFEVRGFGVDVVLIQPGLIRTGFSQRAVTSMDQEKRDSPYLSFNARVARTTQDAYQKGPLALLGGEPSAVAAVIARALRLSRPRARYPVTWSARLILWLRRLLPDGLWDLCLRTIYPQPGVVEA